MKILLVDDNKSITNALSKFLKFKGHECTVVNDGMMGLSMCLSESFDVILLDLAMPEFSGKEFIDELTKDGKIKKQRIIILTAMPIGTIDIEKKGKSGICQVLQKPVGLDVILKTIQEVSIPAE